MKTAPLGGVSGAVHDRFESSVCFENPVYADDDSANTPAFQALERAHARVRVPFLERLDDAGIPRRALYDFGGARLGGHFGAGKHGELVIGVMPTPGRVIDLAAFNLDKPDRWTLLTGAATALNELHLIECAAKGETALLHKTPLDWLRGDCIGACVLQWAAMGDAA